MTYCIFAGRASPCSFVSNMWNSTGTSNGLETFWMYYSRAALSLSLRGAPLKDRTLFLF